MCLLSIKVTIQKKSGNLFNDPCILNLVWFGLVLWHIYYCKLLNAKSFLLNI